MLTVSSIVVEQRFAVETAIRNQYGIDRHYWIPLVTLSIAITADLIPAAAVTDGLSKIDILALIVTLAFLADGLRKSNVFSYIAYTVVLWADGQTNRLLVGLYIAVSATTLVTSNDIVVLAFTPILVGILAQTTLENGRLLLLSQFVAANTLSMGWLIGSPTNLIIGQELGINFLTYLLLMTLPALVACGSSLLVLALLYQGSTSSRLQTYAVADTYTIADDIEQPELTRDMGVWTSLFITTVLGVALVTHLNRSLFWCSIPTFILALVYWRQQYTSSIQQPLRRLPHGTVLFGLVFFIIGAAFARTPLFNELAVPLVSSFASDPLASILSGVFGTGILVNIFNDLPAAVILGDLLKQLPLNNVTGLVFTQAVLAGINIGKYITQVGALAGLLWFHQLQVEQDRQDMPDTALPNRTDLLVYGTINFLVTGTVLCVYFLLEWLLLTALL